MVVFFPCALLRNVLLALSAAAGGAQGPDPGHSKHTCPAKKVERGLFLYNVRGRGREKRVL